MSEQLYESLSALVDGEAEDLEVRRLVKAMADAANADAEPMLQQRWARYQLMGAAIRSDATGTDAVDSALLDRINGQLDSMVASDEQAAIVDTALDTDRTGLSEISDATASSGESPPVAARAERGTTHRQIGDSPWKRLAIAASVAVVATIGFQQFQSQPGQIAPLDTFAQSPAPAPIAVTADSQLVSTEAVRARRLQPMPSGLQNAGGLQSPEAERRLNEYLLQHANLATQQANPSMAGFTRYVSFEQE